MAPLELIQFTSCYKVEICHGLVIGNLQLIVATCSVYFMPMQVNCFNML